jgi:hypothetical protein
MDFWRHLLDSGEAGEIEARLRRYDGDYRWFLFRIEPVRDNRGEIFKWYGANTDIEDRKRRGIARRRKKDLGNDCERRWPRRYLRKVVRHD